MDSPIDKRGKLDEEIFSYKVSKDKKVFIFWYGKQAAILSGSKAENFLTAMASAVGKETQLIMAKATGNFKRGNEKRKG